MLLMLLMRSTPRFWMLDLFERILPTTDPLSG